MSDSSELIEQADEVLRLTEEQWNENQQLKKDINTLINSCATWSEEAIQQKERAERAESFIIGMANGEHDRPDCNVFLKLQAGFMKLNPSDGHDSKGKGHDNHNKQNL